ncbi:hypothetical protein BS50DRAFT_222230 [Corynespora cassiicola Philippines]|uniref:CoA-dependent acyltransferase n=1 Tax=Corynespora cassiicola Philippines TaxID=1448308 RepID=A0A2T2N3A3_CORCC|nr:hypothetical protein BS50DRAFT_222230 [Corynespora cassiicola Philippines]
MAEASHLKFEWKQNLGIWERDIDEAENFYTCLSEAWKGSGRMFFAITGFLSISLEVPQSSMTDNVEAKLQAAFQKAWLRLRFDHPTIASRTEYNHERKRYIKLYRPMDGVSPQSETCNWLEKTFIPLTTEISGLEWCNSDPPAPDYPTLFLISSKSPDGGKIIRRDVVIRSPHNVMDGIGALMLLERLILYASQFYDDLDFFQFPPPGSEATNLSPPLRVAAAIPSILSMERQRDLQLVIEKNASFKTEVDLMTVPFKRGQQVPGKHQRTFLKLSTMETRKILDASKKLGATVTHIYHASISLALRDLQIPGTEKQTKRYINYCLVNERPKCNGVFATSEHPVTVYHSVSGESLVVDLEVPSVEGQPCSQVERRAEFLAVTEKVKEYYESIRNSTSNLELVPSFWALGTPSVPDSARSSSSDIPIPPPDQTPSVSISSMGVVDKIIAPQHGQFKTHDPWVTGEELGTGLGVFLGTWEGSLVLSAAYNDAWHDRDEVDDFLKRCQEIVIAGIELHDS